MRKATSAAASPAEYFGKPHRGDLSLDLAATLKTLEHVGHPFPEKALNWALSHQAEVTPALLDSLRETPAQTMEREDTWFLNVFAMYLLAQFREKAAFQPIIDYQAAITEAEDALTEGVVTEGLNRIPASLYPGEDTAIRQLIENPGANEWVRGAAVDVYPALLASGQITRPEVVDYFRYLLDRGLERKWSFVWDALVMACADIHPDGLLPSLESAYAEDLVDPSVCSLDSLRRDLALTPEETLAKAFARRTPLIEDTVKELSWWACFQAPRPMPNPIRDNESPARTYMATNRVTVAKGPKIGRNEPCPCGSGKNYKKCCLLKGM